MIKGFVFDLDHTLFDRYATLACLMPEFCEFFDVAQGMTPDKASELIASADKKYVHLGWPRVLKELEDTGMFNTVPEFSEYMNFLLSHFEKTAIPFEFTTSVLCTLKEKGYKLGLITNGKGRTQEAKLKLLGIRHLFDEVIIGDVFGIPKPAPEPFWAMAKSLGAEPSELLYVGDNPINDIEASRNAGYIPVWVMTTGTWVTPDIEKPELRVEDVSQLCSDSFLAQINSLT